MVSMFVATAGAVDAPALAPFVGAAVTLALFDALMKYDVLTGVTEVHEFGPGNYGSEVVFIPRDGATAEDDGYLSMYCYNSATGRSEVWIYSAQRVSDGPFFRFKIGQDFDGGGSVRGGVHRVAAENPISAPARIVFEIT